MQREKLGSRLGFILLSAGCAIGVGNVWKFPYVAGQNGGAVFVLLYLIFLAILATPILAMEFSVGRAAGVSPLRMFHKLQKPGQKWGIHGYVCFLASYLLMAYYTTVAGWILYYVYLSATGQYMALDGDSILQLFVRTTESPAVTCGSMCVVTILGFLVLGRGLQKGLEPVAKVMTSALLILLLALVARAVTIDGSKEGLEFFLLPNWERAREAGFFTVANAALAQAFFTLGLGIGSMAIFGSYFQKDRTLLGESVNVVALDTLVALAAGAIVFPICFAYSVKPDSGPSLLFITLPNVFNALPLGKLWGTLFFLFMTAAAFGTVLAVFESIVAMGIDLTGWSRRKVCYVNIPIVIAASLPCALGFNVWSGVCPLGEGTNILDLEDFFISYLAVPLGSLVFTLFCVSDKGWGWNAFLNEANAGKGLKVGNGLRAYMTYVVPTAVFAIFLLGLAEKFQLVDKLIKLAN